MTKPHDKHDKAYVANHLYHALIGRWPEKDWYEAIEATDPLYLAAMQRDPYVSNDTIDLYRMLMDLHGI